MSASDSCSGSCLSKHFARHFTHNRLTERPIEHLCPIQPSPTLSLALFAFATIIAYPVLLFNWPMGSLQQLLGGTGMCLLPPIDANDSRPTKGRAPDSLPPLHRRLFGTTKESGSKQSVCGQEHSQPRRGQPVEKYQLTAAAYSQFALTQIITTKSGSESWGIAHRPRRFLLVFWRAPGRQRRPHSQLSA